MRHFTDDLVVVPECFDPAPYLTAEPPPSQPWREAGQFAFLSVFDWTRHKGWDVLLRGFLEAFAGHDDVTLLLKVWSTLGYSPEAIQQQAAEFVRQTMGHDLLADKRIRWISQRLTSEEMIALYRSSDAFVLPSRGEGWGRPYMEAMACGLPTIGTNWSGNTAFMNTDNSYLLDYRLAAVPEACWPELPTYRGHRWAEPSREDLKRQLRRVVEDRAEAQAIGRRAQAEVTERFSRQAVGKLVAAEIARLRESRQAHPVPVSIPSPNTETARETDRPDSAAEIAHGRGADRRSVAGARKSAQVPKQPVTLRWEGDFFQWHSLALVNREFCTQLLGPCAEVSLILAGHTHFPPESDPKSARLAPHSFAALSRPAEVHVRHHFPPRFARPDEGRFVLIQPWEYGFLPSPWIQPIQDDVDEVWCYSNYVRQVYLDSGISKEKLHVVPLGVDETVFHPDAPPYVFPTPTGREEATEGAEDTDFSKRDQGRSGPFVFLFVGGTLQRKGIDTLLEAYVRAFSAYDDVVLLIKDMGTKTVYREGNHRERILQLAADASRARIVYLDDELTSHELAGIYTAADCLVQPYRGEGFCLPALEAMACGVPVVVTAGGPTDDFVDDTVGWRLPAEKKPFGEGRIGPWECVGPTWMWEVSPHDLARQMRQVFNHPEEAKRKGAAARQRVEQGWTWRHAAQVALERLEALRQRPPRAGKAAPPKVIVAKSRPSPPPTDRPRLIVVDSKSVADQGEGAHSGKNGAVVPVRKAPTLSLCMIVKNEERVLGDCLASIQPYVDEIIVVDTGSTDRTVEIAEEHGAKVFFFAWCDDFSAARNVSLSHATGEWVLWMDADDTIPPECGAKLHDLVMLAEDRVTGFILQVHIPPAPGDNGFTIVDHVKLFRNWPNLRFIGRIHEQILEPIYKAGGTIERTDLYVVHSGYDYSPEGQQRKRERDLTILQKDLADRPDHPFVLFNIGMTAYHLKEWDNAVEALERCRSLSKPHESTVRKVYAMLAGSYLERRELPLAKERLEQGLRLFPQDPELNFRGGILYRELGNPAAAEMCYKVVLGRPEQGHIDSLDVSMTGYKAHHNLGLLYQETGRLPEAEREWRAAVDENPNFLPSWQGLAQLYAQMRRFEDARIAAERIAELEGRG